MRLKLNLAARLIIIYIFALSPIALAAQPVSQIDEAQTTAETYTLAETIKAVENQLVDKLIDERTNKTLHKAAKKQVRQLLDKAMEAGRHLSQSEKIAVLKRLSSTSKSSLKQLSKFSSSRWQSYMGALRNNRAASQLKKIVATSADDASTAVLKQIAYFDDLIGQGKNISKANLKALMDRVKDLSPKQAKAGYDLIAKKLGNEWKSITKGGSATASFVGTVVDGVFVLNDAYSIYYSDDSAEEKFVQASGKIIEYGSSTGSMVAVGAVQGAGATALSSFLPGLVVALSANRVAALYSEIMLLQRDRAAAKSAEEKTKLDLALLVRRQLLNISNLIQKGNLSQAEFLLVKTERYLFKHSVHSQDNLFDLLNNLKNKFKTAERTQQINQIINSARYPYERGLLFYRQGRELSYAKQQAQKAVDVLQKAAERYPELKKSQALAHSKKLLAAVKRAIAQSKPLTIASIAGNKRVVAGSTAYFTIKLNGGIPDYKPVDLEGAGDNDSVTIAWDAPDKEGKRILAVCIQDDQGKQVTTRINLEVIAAMVQTDSDDVGDVFRKYADPYYDIDFSQLKAVKLGNKNLGKKGFYPAPYWNYWGDMVPCKDTTCFKNFFVVQYRNKTTDKPAGMALGFEDASYSKLRIVTYYTDKKIKNFLAKPKPLVFSVPSMWGGEHGIKGFMRFDSQERKTGLQYTELRGADLYDLQKGYEKGKLWWKALRRNGKLIEKKDYSPEPATEAERIKRDMFKNFMK